MPDLNENDVWNGMQDEGLFDGAMSAENAFHFEKARTIRLPKRCGIYEATKLFHTVSVQKLLEILYSLKQTNGVISRDALELIALELDIPYELEEDTEQLRSPIMAVQGHVDHGKTTLLDALRGGKTLEAGNITQKITAYPLNLSLIDKTITIFDTPGHQLFHQMRAIVAGVIDILLLIVLPINSCFGIRHAWYRKGPNFSFLFFPGFPDGSKVASPYSDQTSNDWFFPWAKLHSIL